MGYELNNTKINERIQEISEKLLKKQNTDREKNELARLTSLTLRKAGLLPGFTQ